MSEKLLSWLVTKSPIENTNNNYNKKILTKSKQRKRHKVGSNPVQR